MEQDSSLLPLLKNDKTPLPYAVQQGALKTAQFFLEQGPTSEVACNKALDVEDDMFRLFLSLKPEHLRKELKLEIEWLVELFELLISS